ncbi:hypothetical protein IKM56_02905 [Candidatus Saccharibacteria bacterium]|nr:hypothetical protein [Candidatus Saccharibacteria bacterium]
MNRDKLRIVNKIFNDDTIRAVWDSEVEKYYVSVVDVIAALTRSENRAITGQYLKDASLQKVTKQSQIVTV